MKKFMNSTETMLRESLSGFALCHRDIVALDRDFRFVSRRQAKRGKVALISGGGSGHEPLHTGFVGHGMLDAACPGQIFTSPTPDQMVAAGEAVETGAGSSFHREELRRRRHELRAGRGDVQRARRHLVIDDDVAVERSGQGGAGAALRERCRGEIVGQPPKREPRSAH
jgi:dihydroxyacetone kinase-like protein